MAEIAQRFEMKLDKGIVILRGSLGGRQKLKAFGLLKVYSSMVDLHATGKLLHELVCEQAWVNASKC